MMSSAKTGNGLSSKIQSLPNKHGIDVPEQMPDTSWTDSLKKIDVFFSEIGLPGVGNFVGVSLLLTDFSSFLHLDPSVWIVCLLAAILVSIDSLVHYLLMFNTYKTAVGVPSPVIVDDAKTKREKLNFLNKNVTNLSELEQEKLKKFSRSSHFANLKKNYDEMMEEEENATSKANFYKWALLSVFMFLRVGGGYLPLLKFYQLVWGGSFVLFSTVSLSLSIICVTLLISYAISGYLTRKSAISDHACPLPKQNFVDLKENFQKLNPYIDPDSHTPARLNTSEEIEKAISGLLPTPKEASYTDSISLSWMTISEGVIPLLNGFLSMYALLNKAISFFITLENLTNLEIIFIYSFAIVFAIFDAIVNFALMLPVYKQALGFSSESAPDDIKIKKEQLTLFNEDMTELLKKEEIDSEVFEKMNKRYQELLTPAWKEYLRESLLFVLTTLRAGNGIFTIANVSLFFGITLPVWGQAILLVYVAKSAYNAYVTRKTAVSDLLGILPKQEYVEMESNFQLLKLKKAVKRELGEEPVRPSTAEESRGSSTADKVTERELSAEPTGSSIAEKEKKLKTEPKEPSTSEKKHPVARVKRRSSPSSFFENHPDWNLRIKQINDRIFNRVVLGLNRYRLFTPTIFGPFFPAGKKREDIHARNKNHPRQIENRGLL